MTVAESPYAPGKLIASSYRLQRIIGRGGMGEVWEACNVRLGALVAIKLIRSGNAPRSARDRLIQEARATARLRHRSIVRVFDVGQTDHAEPFVVMERLSGENLGQRLQRLGVLSPSEAVKIMLPVVEALNHAHNQGIYHRDVKPDNVFLEQAEHGFQPKLLDFGLVRLEEEAANLKLTETGMAVGSPAYMSPEQARGYRVGKEGDLWAVCVVLYEAICGAMPFQAKNYNGLLREIVESQIVPIPRTIAQGAPTSIIERGLEKDPNKRWRSANDLGRALAAWAERNNIQDDISGSNIAARWGRFSEPDSPSPAYTLADPSDPFAETVTGELAVARTHGLVRSGIASAHHIKPRWLFALGGVVVGALIVSVLNDSGSPSESVQAPAHAASAGASTPAAAAPSPSNAHDGPQEVPSPTAAAPTTVTRVSRAASPEPASASSSGGESDTPKGTESGASTRNTPGRSHAARPTPLEHPTSSQRPRKVNTEPPLDLKEPF
jgi:eukaryotic-like serine/threonine-protein kinase